MGEKQRIKKVVNWLIFNEVAGSDKEIADKLGYTRSSFSQIVNGRVPLSEKFINKLCSLDENINEVWVKTGEGEMFKNNPFGETLASVPNDELVVYKEHLKKRDSQVDELLSILRELILENRELILENKKTDARQDEDAICADAG